MGEAGVAAASGPELMALVVAGTPGAFELLMRTHNQRLYRTARSILRDDAEAEDVVQEAYLLAYRKAASFRGEASVSTWLTRIVVNEANARLRRQQRRDGILRLVPGSREDAVDDAPGAATGRPEEAALRLEARRLIEARIDALPERLRTVFVLRAVEDMSAGETAAALGIPEATVRSCFFRARAMLRTALAHDFDEAAASAFAFDGARCDRIVAAVLARV